MYIQSARARPNSALSGSLFAPPPPKKHAHGTRHGWCKHAHCATMVLLHFMLVVPLPSAPWLACSAVGLLRDTSSLLGVIIYPIMPFNAAMAMCTTAQEGGKGYSRQHAHR